MTNKEIIDRINSTYQMPTDEQILQTLKCLHPASIKHPKAFLTFVKNIIMINIKRVSFKVAKAIREVGYIFSYEVNENFKEYFPTYLEVWLWLWREKKMAIPVDYFGYENNYWSSCVPIGGDKFKFFNNFKDPEEAIVAAIEYLVDNDLIN